MVLIGIHSDLKQKILDLKLCKRESYGDVVQRLYDHFIETPIPSKDSTPKSVIKTTTPAELEKSAVSNSPNSTSELNPEPDNVVDATTPEERSE